MDLQTITLNRGRGITTLTLNRPSEGNAISARMVRELEKTCHRLHDDPSGDPVLVIRGAGDTFCSGIDLRDFPADARPDVRGFSRWERACRAVERLKRVTIAAVDGACHGGGLQLALTCDLRLATDRAGFALHEVRDGFLPGMGTFRLAKFIGLGRARQMALEGNELGADEALRIGLVGRICLAGDLDAAVAGLVDDLSPIHPEAVALTRQLFDESFEIRYEDFLGCFLAAQHRLIQDEAFQARVKQAHEHGLPRPK